MQELVCYCFGYNAADIEKDFYANGRSTIMAAISAQKKFGHCRCAELNPKGG